jgi:hypothetical protein
MCLLIKNYPSTGCISAANVICRVTVIGFFSIDLILLASLGPGVYSASIRNEYQELNK